MLASTTYSLRLAERARNSDEYYRTITAFADKWLAHAQNTISDLVRDFESFRKTAGLPERSFAEGAFEALALGVQLREHATDAQLLPQWLAWVLKELIETQEHWPWAEEAIKAVRGFVGGLVEEMADNAQTAESADRNNRPPAGQPSICNLIHWLQAQGEATQAERFTIWQNYLQTIGARRTRRAILQCLALAADFARASAAALGPYTQGVEEFVRHITPQAHWRYDAELATSTRLEYHLGLLGTEILNRAYRPRFLATRRKIVIVPPCMRARSSDGSPDERCQAVQTPLGAQCQGCAPACHIHQITRLCARHDIAVYSIPDDELSKLCVASGQAGSGFGMIGVACALRNWSAGWEADRLGLAAQGLLLDQAGCKKHWDDIGFPTDTNLCKLQELIGAPTRGHICSSRN